MNKNLTELVFILDKSGSMSGLEDDTIGGYNSMLNRQKNEHGEAVVTTVLFDDQYHLLHDRIKLKGVAPITRYEYYVGGTTALLDAMGKTINKISNVLANTIEDERAGKVIFVITTDGMENSSFEYSYAKIKSMVEEHKEKYGWEFIFLGANIDAVATAEKFGIDEDRASNYKADKEGTELNYKIVSETITKLRDGECVDRTWKSALENDVKKRGK